MENELKPLIVSEIPARSDSRPTKEVQIIDRQPQAQTPRSARSVTWEDQPPDLISQPISNAVASKNQTTAPTASTALTPVRSSGQFKPILHIEVAPDGSISQTRKEKPSSRLLARFQRQMQPPSALRTDSTSVITEEHVPVQLVPKPEPVKIPSITKEEVSKMVDKAIEEYIRMVAESRWLDNEVGEKISKALLGVPYQEKPPLPPRKIVEFIPYFYKPEYLTNDSKTTITDNKMDLFVELIGVVPKLRIYPFGDNSIDKVGNFKEQTLILTIQDDEKTGKAIGKLYTEDDYYVLDIDTLKDSLGTVVEFGVFSLPLTISYNGSIDS